MTLPTLHGHQSIWHRLDDGVARQRLAHALLFVGPAGIGKSLVARLLAARLACSESSATPCGICNGCRQIAAGTHPDLLLVELPSGKKEIGIDLARQLKRFVQMRGTTAKRRVAIVDDADRLSVAAQNALLKSLEEPPGDALMILVTASPGSLLSTVRSRCQRWAFQPLEDAQVRAVLEGRISEPEEIERLVSEAEGSPGRALLQWGLWREGERRELLALLADLGTSRYAPVVIMSKALGRTEMEMAARLEGLLEWYRTQAVCAVGSRDDDARSDSGIDPHRAVRAADIVRQGLQTLRRFNPNRQLLAEALLLRLARL